MTKREFLNDVIDFFECWNAEDADPDESTIPSMLEYARGEISKLDATNAKRRESDKPTKASLEAAAARESIIKFVMNSTEPVDADTICEGAGVSKGQVPSALRGLVADGKVEKSIVKVDSKHRKTVYKYIGE